jgi:chitodextrinase
VEVYGTQVDLDWEGTRGRTPVAAYDIYRDGVLIDSVPGDTPRYSAVDLTPLTPYVFTVVARDVWDRTSLASRPLTVETDETYGDPRRPVGDLAAAATTYTSATLTWQPAPERTRRTRPDVAETIIVQNGREILRLPGGVTTVTVGGLAPGSAYNFSVVTVDATGERSVESPVLVVATIPLPSSATIGETSITETPDQIAYSADFLVPVAFRRVFIATANPADPCWSTGSDPQICSDYMIENERLLKYTGDGQNFDWAVVREVVPTIAGTMYTWLISPADIGSPATSNAVFNSNGYAPNAYCGVGFACVSTGLPLPYE